MVFDIKHSNKLDTDWLGRRKKMVWHSGVVLFQVTDNNKKIKCRPGNLII